jgi:D-alanyl-D-alanine-carboxypeptidase/D-alanyl-D-alanine-endopeptidase
VMKIVCIVFALTSVVSLAQTVPEDTLRTAMVNRVDVARNGIGLIAGVSTPDGRRYVSYGRTSRPSGTAPGPDTIFEIGSITKVFTSLLLADMAERGEVKLDDPVAMYLPKHVKVPSRNDKPITLADLATHTSGLPRDADNLDLMQVNPFADYGPAKLYDFLARYKLPRDPGEKFGYSNVGASLLGHALTLRAGTSYEELLRKRILEPLGMKHTSITLTDSQMRRMADGHDGALARVPLWEVDALIGAASIRSTAADMLTFAEAWLGMEEHPLKAAMERMLAFERPGGAPSMKMRLAWASTSNGLLFHSGRRGGFTAAIALRPATRTAAIVFSNTVEGVDDLAFHAVNPAQRTRHFAPPRVQVTLAESVLESYVGVYAFTPQFSLSVTREGTRMFGQVTGQPRFEMFAERDGHFFLRAVDAQITFQKDDDGPLTALVLHQNGADHKARKVRD